jgi:hypothetical protein
MVPMVVVGWIKEESTFETILNISPTEEVYEDKARKIYARLELGKMRMLSPIHCRFLWVPANRK